MNLLLLDTNDLRDDANAEGDSDRKPRLRTAAVTGRRGQHIRDVLRAGPGTTLRAGLVDGPIGTATVTSIDGDTVTMTIELDQSPTPRPRVDLVLALPRPKVGRRVLQTLATMGVGRIDLVNAWRVDKSYLDSPLYTPEAIRAELLLGCEQGKTTWLPELVVHRRLMAFFDRLDELDATSRPKRCIAHPGVSATLADAHWDRDDQRLVIAIGPEGGWIQREVDTFVDRGFVPVSLSARTLRVETAVVAALAQLELALGR